MVRQRPVGGFRVIRRVICCVITPMLLHNLTSLLFHPCSVPPSCTAIFIDT